MNSMWNKAGDWFKNNLAFGFSLLILGTLTWGYFILIAVKNQQISPALIIHYSSYIQNHALYIIIGVIIFFLIQSKNIDLEKINPMHISYLNLFLCVQLYIFGNDVMGTVRFIRIAGLSINIGAITELLLVISISGIIFRNRFKINRGEILNFAVINILILETLFFQPNYIRVFSIVTLLFISLHLFYAKSDVTWAVRTIATGTVIVLVLQMGFYAINSENETAVINTGVPQFSIALKNGINSVLLLDPLGDSYQPISARKSFVQGGIAGVHNSSPLESIRVPDPLNGYIFAVIGQQYGIIGVIGIGCIFLMFLYFGLQAVIRTETIFEAILCLNLTFLVMIHAFIGMFTAVGLFFPNGLGIPLLSISRWDLLIAWTVIALIFKILNIKQPVKNVLNLKYKSILGVFAIVFLVVLIRVAYFDILWFFFQSYY